MPVSMPLPHSRTLALLALLALAPAGAAQAQSDGDTLAGALSPRVLFVTSGGSWEGTADDAGDADKADAADATKPSDPAAEAAPAPRGYYRLIAIRGADNTSDLQLQQIALTPDGPELVMTTAVEEINALGAYVTDIRPEDSTGTASAPGFAAYIYLKTDPGVAEPETWSLYVDEFGEMQVERSSN
ncbi:hypothetical protein [Hoeflea olei]|uniref:Uncharacterized protein n=1 Tax=Hoeflea olei TaxID=1480615 RepID=A0A1C1YT66_9HYPH|nr:hypothetical protein [Hoeflea olei]OCW56685.1 hypothetical protein AWJ14_17295 [Hoeflea olei]